jgi:hypothetical protein
MGIDAENYVTALAAVAAVGAAPRHVFLSPEAGTAVSAVACDELDLRQIDEARASS